MLFCYFIHGLCSFTFPDLFHSIFDDGKRPQQKIVRTILWYVLSDYDENRLHPLEGGGSRSSECIFEKKKSPIFQ
jgi:hypothetical protein